MQAAVFDATTNLKVVRTGGGAPEAAGSLNPFAGLAAPAADSSLTRRSSIPVALLSATIGGMMLGAPTTIEAATTIFDRTSGVTAQSDVSASHLFSGDAYVDQIAGSKVQLSSTFSPTQYTVMTSSFSGQDFSASFDIGSINLNIYKLNSGTGQYDLLHTIGSSSSTILGTNATNLYGDSVTPLTWNISGIDLVAGDYVFSPYQNQPASQNQAMYLNFVAPSLENLSDWSAVVGLASGGTGNVNFEDLYTLTGGTAGTRHFADSLAGNMVPEPGMTSLLMLGALAAFFRRRR